MNAKYVRIFAVCALMISGVFAIGSIVRHRAPAPPTQGVLVPETIDGEAESFRLADKAMTYAKSVEQGNRTLDSFHARRAFTGAPPVIPHPLLEDKSMGGAGCLGCHRDGGYVAMWKAHTPVTPHPQLENCRQCHVPQQKTADFAGSTWKRTAPPEIDGQQLAGAPPPIPHTLQMRENCLGCHAGPGAVAKIRTPHPERVNCKQCHVPQETEGVFQRAGVQ